MGPEIVVFKGDRNRSSWYSSAPARQKPVTAPSRNLCTKWLSGSSTTVFLNSRVRTAPAPSDRPLAFAESQRAPPPVPAASGTSPRAASPLHRVAAPFQEEGLAPRAGAQWNRAEQGWSRNWE